jgi:MFS family permease
MLKRSPTGTWMPAWVPESTLTLSILLIFCSMVQSATGGYDGSMMNGLNILPSYTDYFNLNAATTGLNTASIFIGGFFGPLCAGVISDRLGRRPAIFWGSVVTLVGVLLQTAAQDIAMFVVARVVLGFGSAVSGIAGGVYLSETFPSQWRAWGVGLLNDFY